MTASAETIPQNATVKAVLLGLLILLTLAVDFDALFFQDTSVTQYLYKRFGIIIYHCITVFGDMIKYAVYLFQQ